MTIFEGSFTNASTLKVGILVARFNDLITNKILSGCLDCLKRHGLDTCLLYTSDAADDSLRVDLGGRRIIKKK